MNKNDYIEAINEIKISEKQKKEVLEKMKEKKKKIILKLSLCAVCCMLVAIALFAPYDGQISKEIVLSQKLTNVKNYEELSAIFKNSIPNPILILEKRFETSTKSSQTGETAVATYSNDNYSNTNVQVEGVEEADIVKTDGDYIYYVSNNSVVIINAQDEKNVSLSYKIVFNYLEFRPEEIYIKNNKLIVIGQDGNFLKGLYPDLQQMVSAKIYNIENKENIVLNREVKVEGNYLSSRMIEDNVYLIAKKNVSYDSIKNEKILLPYYVDTIKSDEKQEIPYESIYSIPENISDSYMNIASFNISENKQANISSYIGVGWNIYASQDNLYVAHTKEEYKYSIFEKITGDYYYKITTNIYKFSLKGDKIEYLCSGEVPGRVLNQFSMDENDGNFRIATTDNSIGKKSTNNVYVLDSKLSIIGKVENLAPGERIYSARFMGDRAYMVTFVTTDPLFVIDLSKPTNPTVLGKLKIPGFSNYLHPYDANHIIGFGKDTSVENYGYGEFVQTEGMKMALFDVTDPTNPIEMYQVKIGDKGTYSELLNNHKALLFSKEKSLLAFPISIRENTNDDYNSSSEQGAIVYNIDLEKGFILKGMISHPKKLNNNYYNSSNNVERIIYINNNLITLSTSMVKLTDMNTMEQISELEIK